MKCPNGVARMDSSTTTIRAQQGPTYLYCSSTSNYTSGSQFEANLNRTLESLTINTPTNNRLYNTSIEGTNDKVYGLAQCRGDLSSQSCQTCLNQSRLNIIKRCSKGKQAAIRYDGCLLRYSDEFFFDKVVNYEYVIIYVLQNMTEPNLFNENLSSLLSEVSQTVSANVSRFSVGATKYEEFFNIYAMGQCMEDLLEGDCYNCLVGLVGVLQEKIPATKKEAKILSASCFLWYSTDLFFSLQSLPSPPPSPSPSIVASSPTPTLTNRTTGEDGKAHDTEITNSLLFDFDTLRVATDDFSNSNKLGEGGFGPVYKAWRHWTKGTALRLVDRSLGKEKLQRVLSLSPSTAFGCGDGSVKALSSVDNCVFTAHQDRQIRVWEVSRG
ncbi:Cysteine-rich receptor-like protein kinase 25 [Acorus calamus]|uniref:Cysteine-rich receptor-like protein kinase 25 n=1 Tax=Acorus calamus TaxID=4465 RepID=A0AAV9FKM3_ACOCL|nr:Cysteine-rich receptor-like protein kinase 25 [Acorus calamus]